MIIRSLTIVSGLIFSLLALSAEIRPLGEGLHISDVPPAITDAWQSTFVLGSNSFTASAFAISKISVNEKHFAIFISGDHVYRDLLSERLRTGAKGHVFSNVLFARNLEFSVSTRSKKFIDRVHGPYIEGITDPSVDGWMFAVEVDPGWSTPLLKFSKNCQYDIGDKNFLVGYPSVPLRPQHVQRVPIEKSGTITRRWSSGVFTDSPFVDPLIATTADSLPGNSGGPVLNEDGEVIGALVTGNQVASITGEYQKDYQGVVSQCQALKDFKEQALPQLIQKLQTLASE